MKLKIALGAAAVRIDERALDRALVVGRVAERCDVLLGAAARGQLAHERAFLGDRREPADERVAHPLRPLEVLRDDVVPAERVARQVVELNGRPVQECIDPFGSD